MAKAETLQQQLHRLRQAEATLSDELRNFTRKNPDQLTDLGKQRKLDDIRKQIQELQSSIAPDSSSYTPKGYTPDPQGARRRDKPANQKNRAE